MIKFWQDSWLENIDALESNVTKPIPPYLKDCMMADMVTNGAWKFANFSTFIDDETKALILATFPPHINGGNDSLYWRIRPSGQFILKSTTDYLLKIDEASHREYNDKSWDYMWN